LFGTNGLTASSNLRFLTTQRYDHEQANNHARNRGRYQRGFGRLGSRFMGRPGIVKHDRF
jgi:hypothetical protein